ncbi:MAG: type IV secretion system protein VirB4 [Alphaproteobacteria bacterium]
MPHDLSPFGERSGLRYVRHYGHLAEDAVLMEDGTLCAVIAVPGRPFELADPRQLNAHHTVHAALLRAVADDDVQLYEHLVQHDAVPAIAGGEPRRMGYGAELARDYAHACLGGLRETSWFLTILVRPRFVVGGWRGALGMTPRSQDMERARRGSPALDHRRMRLEDRVSAVLAALPAARRLGVRVAADVAYSEIAEAHRMALYARWMPVPLVAPGRLGASIYSDRVVCGMGGFEVHLPGGGRAYGTMQGFRVYPRTWRVGMADPLIGLPCRFSLTNSYRFHSRAKAGDKLALIGRRMDSAGDRAHSLREELVEAMDAVDRGEHVMGEHHWSLAVHVDRWEELEPAAAAARSQVTDMGAVAATEDVAMEAAFFAQVPGSPGFLRARAGAVSSVVYAALSSLHAHPTGEATHHWGRPLFRLRTTGGTAYDHGMHLRDVGHTLLIGPTGGGKTVWIAFCLVMLDALVGAEGGTQILFDKDGGNETVVRAMGGRYVRLAKGEHSGAAPLKALPDGEAARAWLQEFVAGLILADGRGALTPEDARRLATGIAFIMRLPPAMRSLAGLREFLGHGDPLGAGARLERWCHGGALGWAFDGETDGIAFDAPLAAVDPTALLDHETVMPPLAAYLLHRAGSVMDGRRAVLWVDEFRAYLPDPRFADGFEDFALTGRKKNWALCIATQQPEHILDHPTGPSLIGQCKTRVLFRNPDARPGPYRQGLGCTEREFQAVTQDMMAGPHSVLIKREDRSVLCRFDLSGLPQHLPVLSGTERSVRLLREVIAHTGREEASAWLDEFRRRLPEAAA